MKDVVRRGLDRVVVRLVCKSCGAVKEKIRANKVGEREYWRFWKSKAPLVEHGRHDWEAREVGK